MELSYYPKLGVHVSQESTWSLWERVQEPPGHICWAPLLRPPMLLVPKGSKYQYRTRLIPQVTYELL